MIDEARAGSAEQRMIVIGLTGGIASGKSTVSQILSELGAVVIDADKVGHEAFRPRTDAWREVVSAFGRGILGPNEEIDRAKLADVVFKDPGALERLNTIMHPLMRRTVEQRIEALRCQGEGVLVLEAALLIEANWTDLADKVWVVAAPESVVIERLCSRKGYTGEQARARIASQMPLAERAKHADAVIENNSDRAALKGKVEALWHGLRLSGTANPGARLAGDTAWRQKVRDRLASRERRVVTREGFRASAVLVPIYEKAGEHYVVLTKRTQDLEHHKGQICFPGGAYDDADGDLRFTVLREAFEEIGVRAQDVEILGALDDQATLSSYFVITPFVGAIPYPYVFEVNRREVEELIEAPVSELLDPACYSSQTADSRGELQPWGHYRFRGHSITGITARILDQFLGLFFT